MGHVSRLSCPNLGHRAHDENTILPYSGRYQNAIHARDDYPLSAYYGYNARCAQEDDP
jgi:hypothetical protein